MISMAFAFLCFTGIFVMFLYLMRSLEKFQEHTRDEHAQLKVQVRVLEARLEMLAGAVPAPISPSARAPLSDGPQAPLVLAPQDFPDAAPHDPLMRFDPKR